MQRRVLHITNGDSAAGLIRASGLPGDVLPWRDPMHHGPMPPDIDLAALSAVRAAYLSGPGHSADSEFQARDAALRQSLEFEAVVLWFEHDLLDQLQILQVLDWFAAPGNAHPDLQMICIGAFDGMPSFRGLGELSPQQIASLWPDCKSISAAALASVRNGWAAFRSEDPHAIEQYLLGADAVTPFMRPALHRHLQEFPDSVTGLMRSEKHVLDVVAAGETRPGAAFGRVMDRERWLFGGDLRFFQNVADLTNGLAPLLTCEPGPKFQTRYRDKINRETFLAQRLSVSPTGKALLAGTESAFGLLQRDMHLGGVHIRSGAPMWTWNGQSKALELRD
jgi:hypothetical protein